MTDSVLATLAGLRIVPVVEIEEVSSALPLADALIEAGLPAMEVTLRTPAALAAIREVRRERPGFLVGAGTLLTAADVSAAATAGAQFLVSPGRTDALTAAARDSGLELVPGAVTPSEIMGALDAGHTHVKFFPAAQYGGAAAISSLAAPLAATGVRFMPTGGIRPESLASYLAVAAVFAVGGTWIAPRDLLREARFDVVAERAVAALAVSVREPKEG